MQSFSVLQAELPFGLGLKRRPGNLVVCAGHLPADMKGSSESSLSRYRIPAPNKTFNFATEFLTESDHDDRVSVQLVPESSIAGG